MKIVTFTILKNESAILPFFLRHYSAFVDKIIIWDEQSTDGTREIIKACPKAELRDWDGKGIDDYKFKTFSEQAYKEARGHFDWCIWPDVDEFIWAPDVRAVLADSNQFDAVTTAGFNMVHDGLPVDDGRQIWEIAPMGVNAPVYAKKIVFKPDKDLHWSTGKHHLECNVTLSPPRLKLLHYRFLGETYTRERNARNYQSAVDKGHAWSCAPDWTGAHSPQYAKEIIAEAFNVIESPLYYEGFDGDGVLHSTVKQLILDHGIRTAIETGTRDGSTALLLANLAEVVFSIEAHIPYLELAQRRGKAKQNLTHLYGSSDDVLPKLLPYVTKPLLVFLDAHGGERWPLHGELKALRGFRDVVVIIHDVKIPGSDLGFDSYGGQDLTIDYFFDLIPPIYNGKFKWWTNKDHAEGGRRGVFFAAPEPL